MLALSTWPPSGSPPIQVGAVVRLRLHRVAAEALTGRVVLLEVARRGREPDRGRREVVVEVVDVEEDLCGVLTPIGAPGIRLVRVPRALELGNARRAAGRRRERLEREAPAVVARGADLFAGLRRVVVVHVGVDVRVVALEPVLAGRGQPAGRREVDDVLGAAERRAGPVVEDLAVGIVGQALAEEHAARPGVDHVQVGRRRRHRHRLPPERRPGEGLEQHELRAVEPRRAGHADVGTGGCQRVGGRQRRRSRDVTEVAHGRAREVDQPAVAGRRSPGGRSRTAERRGASAPTRGDACPPRRRSRARGADRPSSGPRA